jgi:hypothetical protein
MTMTVAKLTIELAKNGERDPKKIVRERAKTVMSCDQTLPADLERP